jgi:anti-anti-sigma factor
VKSEGKTMMEIKSMQHNGVIVVSVIENLDATTSAQAKAYLSAEIEEGHTNLVIDTSNVTHLSSAGLRVILATMQKARSAGGDVRLAGAAGKIQQVVDMAGFSKIMKTFPTAEEAVTSYVS